MNKKTIDKKTNNPSKGSSVKKPFDRSKNSQRSNRKTESFSRKKPYDRSKGSTQNKSRNHRFSNNNRKNIRAVAIEILDEVLYRNRLLDDAIEQGLRKVAIKDRGILYSICYGVLRWHGILKLYSLSLIGEQSGEIHSKVLLVIESGIWQLNEGYAEHAAIFESVEAIEQLGLNRAKNFVNAILRKAQRNIEDNQWKLQTQTEYDKNQLIPEWLNNLISGEDFSQDLVLRLSTKAHHFKEQIQPFCKKLHNEIIDLHTQQPKINIRVSTNRIKREDYLKQLHKLNIDCQEGCFEDSITINQSVMVDRLPGYSVGAFVVQDLATQCAAHILKPSEGTRVLDACAAPGGKTSHLQSIANHTLELFAVELDTYRSRKLRENLGRLRINGKVINGSALTPSDWWDGHPMQSILLDVPCSGTGVMRRNPDIPWLKSSNDIIMQSAESIRMLNRLWHLLDNNGLLLFATCSVLPEENDMVIESFLKNYSNAKTIDFNIPLASLETIYGKQILPTVDNDSLYYCLLQKNDS